MATKAIDGQKKDAWESPTDIDTRARAANLTRLAALGITYIASAWAIPTT